MVKNIDYKYRIFASSNARLLIRKSPRDFQSSYGLELVQKQGAGTALHSRPKHRSMYYISSTVTCKVNIIIIYKSRGEDSLLEQPRNEWVFLAYSKFMVFSPLYYTN